MFSNATDFRLLSIIVRKAVERKFGPRVKIIRENRNWGESYEDSVIISFLLQFVFRVLVKTPSPENLPFPLSPFRQAFWNDFQFHN